MLLKVAPAFNSCTTLPATSGVELIDIHTYDIRIPELNHCTFSKSRTTLIVDSLHNSGILKILSRLLLIRANNEPKRCPFQRGIHRLGQLKLLSTDSTWLAIFFEHFPSSHGSPRENLWGGPISHYFGLSLRKGSYTAIFEGQ